MYFSRGKNKIQGLDGLAEVYKYYIDYNKGNELYDINYKLYKSILIEYYKTVVSELLYKGYSLKLPYRFGHIRIIKRKIDINNLTRFGINWVESVKEKKVIHHLNMHSKNYIYRFKWEKINTLIPNLYFYKFVASRSNKRGLAQIIKNRQCDYFEQ